MSGYDDAFLWSGVDNVSGESIEDFIRRSYSTADMRRQPNQAIDDVVRAVKIAFNVIMYWGTLKDEEDWMHPDTLQKLNKIKKLEEKARNTRKRKKREGLENTGNDLKKKNVKIWKVLLA